MKLKLPVELKDASQTKRAASFWRRRARFLPRPVSATRRCAKFAAARARTSPQSAPFWRQGHLYLEVLRYAHGKALEKYPPMLDLPDDAPPEKKLRAFVHSMLQRIFDKGPTSWHGKLMSREMIEPTKALDSLVEERMRPMVAQLWKIVAEILIARSTTSACGCAA